MALPSTTLDATVYALSQDASEPHIATARWRGTRLRQIFREHTGTLLVMSADGRTVRLTQDRLDQALLAYSMNDVPLPAEQGAPLRLIVPGAHDGLMPGWVRRIEAVQGSDDAPENQSHPLILGEILMPTVAYAGARTAARGYAYAGLSPVNDISLSIDSGGWLPVEYEPGCLGVWARWGVSWIPSSHGFSSLRLKVRTTNHEQIFERTIRVEARTHG